MNESDISPVTPEKEVVIPDRIDHLELAIAEETAAREILDERIGYIETITEEIAARDRRIARIEAMLADVILALLKQGVSICGTETIKLNRLAEGQLLKILFPDPTEHDKPKEDDPPEDCWELYQ